MGRLAAGRAGCRRSSPGGVPGGRAFHCPSLRADGLHLPAEADPHVAILVDDDPRPDDPVRLSWEEFMEGWAQLREVAHEIRLLRERLAGARDNNRFLDKRVADLEARLAESLGLLPAGG